MSFFLKIILSCVCLPPSRTWSYQASHPSWPFIFCLCSSYFLMHSILLSHPLSLLVTPLLPGLTAQIQMDYCKPVNLSESAAQWWQVTARGPMLVFPLLPRIRCHSQNPCASMKQVTACGQVTLNLHLIKKQIHSSMITSSLCACKACERSEKATCTCAVKSAAGTHTVYAKA